MKNIEIKEAYTVHRLNTEDWDDYYHVSISIGNRCLDFQPFKSTVKHVPLKIYIFIVILANLNEDDPFGLIELEKGFIIHCRNAEKHKKALSNTKR